MDRYEKRHADAEIARRLLDSDIYKASDTLLCYISSEIEVDTLVIVTGALSDGKAVYVPKCGEGNAMSFFRIFSMNDLHAGAYGILEPDDTAENAQEYKGDAAICIVPGLSFDMHGDRLGFGMGFYDRFLAGSPQLYTVGLCYHSCIMDKLPSEETDIKVKRIITEVKTIDTEV